MKRPASSPFFFSLVAVFFPLVYYFHDAVTSMAAVISVAVIFSLFCFFYYVVTYLVAVLFTFTFSFSTFVVSCLIAGAGIIAALVIDYAYEAIALPVQQTSDSRRPITAAPSSGNGEASNAAPDTNATTSNNSSSNNNTSHRQRKRKKRSRRANRQNQLVATVADAQSLPPSVVSTTDATEEEQRQAYNGKPLIIQGEGLQSLCLALNTNNDSDACPVCLDSFQKELADTLCAILPCQHAFCLPCLVDLDEDIDAGRAEWSKSCPEKETTVSVLSTSLGTSFGTSRHSSL